MSVSRLCAVTLLLALAAWPLSVSAQTKNNGPGATSSDDATVGAGASLKVVFVPAKQLLSDARKVPEQRPSTSWLDYLDIPGYSASVIRRTEPGRSEVHKGDTEIQYVIEGTGSLVTGGSLIEGVETEPNALRGSSISGGDERHVAPGDLIVIPVGVPHWLRAIDGKDIVYLSVKSDSGMIRAPIGKITTWIPSLEQTVSPSPEMQRIFNTQLGRWSQRLERPDGSSGEGEAVWRPGPGGMSLLENEYIRSTAGDSIGLSVTWWDDAVKGYRALWCDNKIKNGCLVMSQPAHWEGDQFVLRDEFEKDGKKFVYKEVESQITPTTYTLTSYTGERGGELKPTSTVRATKITDSSIEFSNETALQQVLAADEARRLAMLHGDFSALDSLLADDVTIFWGDGTADDKASTLALFRSGRLRYVQLDYEKPQVRLYGETAVVTGQARVKEQTGNEKRSYIVRLTRVYAHQQDRWRLVASQTTRMEPMP